MTTPTLTEAMDVLKSELSKDKEPGSYFYGWQSNIAMSFHGSFAEWAISNPHKGIPTPSELVGIANAAAKNFLNQVIS